MHYVVLMIFVILCSGSVACRQGKRVYNNIVSPFCSTGSTHKQLSSDRSLLRSQGGRGIQAAAEEGQAGYGEHILVNTF